MQDLIKFAAPEGVVSERRCPARSMVVPLAGSLSRDRLRDMPDELVYAIASALDDAAIEMEVQQYTGLVGVCFFVGLSMRSGKVGYGYG